MNDMEMDCNCQDEDLLQNIIFLEMSLKVRTFQFKQFQEETATQLSYVHIDGIHNGYIISVFRYRIIDFHIEQARRKLIKAWA